MTEPKTSPAPQPETTTDEQNTPAVREAAARVRTEPTADMIAGAQMGDDPGAAHYRVAHSLMNDWAEGTVLPAADLKAAQLDVARLVAVGALVPHEG